MYSSGLDLLQPLIITAGAVVEWRATLVYTETIRRIWAREFFRKRLPSAKRQSVNYYPWPSFHCFHCCSFVNQLDHSSHTHCLAEAFYHEWHRQRKVPWGRHPWLLRREFIVRQLSLMHWLSWAHSSLSRPRQRGCIWTRLRQLAFLG